MAKVRYARDGSGWRVYVGGDLLGSIRRDRVVVVERTGRKANRWHYSIAAAAWGLGAAATPIPPEAPIHTLIGPLGPEIGGRVAAARQLVETLQRHGCPAVAPLHRSAP